MLFGYDVLQRSPLLFTDLYELTMSYSYWRAGLHERDGAFHVCYRDNPFRGGYAVAAGLRNAVEFLENLRLDPADRDYLAAQTGNDGEPLFRDEFLQMLVDIDFACDVDAVPEGTVVFPHEPLVRVTGPLWQAQLVETALLNLINFPTLIATKAARVVRGARGDAVVEFGLRRAQGPDGGLTVARAAYIGGCAGTSNTLAGPAYGVPVKGTIAHSWVMCFDDEREAFQAYAEAMPNNALFLVDTYDTLQGVRHAIEAGRWLRENGHEMIGIRLDSGDLAWLSQQARRLLDEAGFEEAVILGSGDLDEHVIDTLKEEGCTISVWGVGTKLATARDDPALGGVYKLSAVRNGDGEWEPRIKLSEQSVKVNNPGVLGVRRFVQDGQPAGDAIYDVHHPPAGRWSIVHPADPNRRKRLPAGEEGDDLLVPVFRDGRRVYDAPPLAQMRRRARDQLASFDRGVTRLADPYPYPAGLEEGLHEEKNRLIRAVQARTERRRDERGGAS
jgi:nicotinate phosphoribosyltransferase